jgi:hypothetical protein
MRKRAKRAIIASQKTRRFGFAQGRLLRAARPDCLRLRSGQALTAQKTLVRNDN